MSTYDYDLITIGAGSGGVRATRLAGGYGARAAIIEKSRVGGTCVMRGCVPKKLLVYGAHFADEFADARGFGWMVGENRHDWPALIERKNVELDRLETVYRGILEKNSVPLIEGDGRVVDAHTVAVNGQRMTAERILIASGGWPFLPSIPGIEHVITSNEALDLPQAPARVLVVGGGYIAVEFAGIFNCLGAEVTLCIRADHILRGFDQDVRSALEEEIIDRGIVIRSRTELTSIEKTASGLTVHLSDGTTMEVDQVMHATGRKPNTQTLGLAEIGVEMAANGAVKVNAWNQSSVPSIYAVGDCTDRINLTPVAIAEGRAFAETFFNNNPMTVDYERVPSAVFSTPPIGSVGLTEEAARKRGSIDVYVTRFRPMKATLSGRKERTMMKLIVDRATDRVVGCHMVGSDAPEIIQGLAIALKAGAKKADFDATIGIHPTAAEEFVTLREPRVEPAIVVS